MCYGFLQQISGEFMIIVKWQFSSSTEKLFSAHRYLSTDDLGTKLILFFHEECIF